MSLVRFLRKKVSISYFLFSIPVLYLINIIFCSSSSISTDPLASQKKPLQAYLVIMVMTAPDELERRQAVRQTWLDTGSAELLSYFVIGTRDLSARQRSLLYDEHEQYKDLMLLDSFADQYSTLTRKLLDAYKWLNEHVEFRFALKTDVDSYVRVQSILMELQQYAPLTRYYWGYFDGNAPVFRKSAKWSEPDWVISDRYLPYALGGGYLISEDLVEFVARNSDLLKLYNAEDASLGSWLAPLDITRKHDRRFDTEYMSRGCHDDYLITHKQTIGQLHRKHSDLSKFGKLCGVKGEFIKRGAYEYDWSVLPSRCCLRSKKLH